jgi:hypothetical protein
MFDFLNAPCRTGIANSDAAQNAFQPLREDPPIVKEMQEIRKIVDAMCKVYVAEHAKEIADRGYADKFYQTDQPIIDRANVLELERKIKVAEMELKELTRSRRI